MISNRLQLLTLILFAAPVEAAALECQIDQVQEVRTDDPTFGTDLNLRGEAKITVAKYKSQFVPVCSVVFGAQTHFSTYKDHCEHRNVILAGVLSRTSTDDASLTLIGAKTFEKVDIPMLAYSSTYKPVTNDDLVAYLRGKESSGQGIMIEGEYYHVYVMLEYNPKEKSAYVYKTYRLEVFADSDKQCMEEIPENQKLYSKAGSDRQERVMLATPKSPPYLRINETQVGDGSEPKHN